MDYTKDLEKLENLLLDVHSRAYLLKFVNATDCPNYDFNELLFSFNVVSNDIVVGINNCLELLEIISNSNSAAQ